MSHTFSTILLVLLLLVLSSCSQGPERVSMPEFEPDAVADRAIKLLDKDGNSLLSRKELNGSPGLLSSLSIFDHNGDQQIAREEIATELRKWREEKAGLIPLHCEVTWKGTPLGGAVIRMIPEPFFDGAISSATGQTDQNGQAEMSCAREDLPATLKSLHVVQPGVYRVEVSHPTIDLPSEYNNDTRLGRSVSLRNAYALQLDL